MELQLTTRHEGDVAIVGAQGEVDVFTAPGLDAELDALVSGGNPRLVVDLTGVAFLDSTGLGVLVKALNNRGRKLMKVIMIAQRPQGRIMIAVLQKS